MTMLLLLALTASPAEARRLAREATILYNTHEYQSALNLFQTAYQHDPQPDLLYDIGSTEKQLGQHTQAIATLKQYIATKPAQNKRIAAEILIQECETALANQPRIVRPAAAEPAPMVYEHPSIATRWWFWTSLIGGAAIVGAVTAGVVVSLSSNGPPTGSLGTVQAR